MRVLLLPLIRNTSSVFELQEARPPNENLEKGFLTCASSCELRRQSTAHRGTDHQVQNALPAGVANVTRASLLYSISRITRAQSHARTRS